MVFMYLYGIACTYCCVISNLLESVISAVSCRHLKEMVGLLCTVLIIF